MTQPKVLVVLSSHDKIGDTGKPTGWYLPEFAHPYKELAPHATITVASPAGGAAPLDPSSIDKNDQVSMDFLQQQEPLFKQTQKLETFAGRAKDFDALFFVGGHGPMFDLAPSSTSQALIRDFWAADRIVAAVCHGPAALVNVRLADGTSLLADAPVTGFSNAEEDAMGLSAAMPFALEDALSEKSGGRYEKAAEPWGVKVVVAKGGRLITGQNPASATAVGEAIVRALAERK